MLPMLGVLLQRTPRSKRRFSTRWGFLGTFGVQNSRKVGIAPVQHDSPYAPVALISCGEIITPKPARLLNPLGDACPMRPG
jgi:hypothetical protein